MPKSSKAKKPPVVDVLSLVGKTILDKYARSNRPERYGKVVATWMSTDGEQIYEVMYPGYKCGIGYTINEIKWHPVVPESDLLRMAEESLLQARRSGQESSHVL